MPSSRCLQLTKSRLVAAVDLEVFLFLLQALSKVPVSGRVAMRDQFWA